MSIYIPPVSKLAPGIIRILGCNPGKMTLQGTNTYLLGTGIKRILIDTGDSDVPRYLNNLNQVLRDENAQLEHIVITHHHPDHIGGAADIVKLHSITGCKVWKYKIANESKLLYNRDNINIFEIKCGQQLSVDGVTLRVEHTPGHTDDHIALLVTETNALFSGDCILGEGTAVFEDLYDYMISLQRILNINPSVIYPGHGPVIKNPREKIEYYINHRNQREEEIYELLHNNPSKEWTEMDIVKVIYADKPSHLHQPAAYNVYHHLEKLLKEGKVYQYDSKWSLQNHR